MSRESCFENTGCYDFDSGDEFSGWIWSHYQLGSLSASVKSRSASGIVPNPDVSGLDSSTNSLMSLDFPKRSNRKILERIIPLPLGGWDKLRYARFQRVSLNQLAAVRSISLARTKPTWPLKT